jgi:hypothetical protein
MTPSQKIIALSERWLAFAEASDPTEPPPEEAFDLWYAILSLVISNGPKLTKGVRAQLKENLKATGSRPAFQELEAKPWKLALTFLKHPKDFKSTLHDEVTIHLDSELPEYRLTMIELAWVFHASLNATDALARLLCNVSNNDEYAEESIGLAYHLLKNDPKVLVEYLKIATPVDAQKHAELIREIKTTGTERFVAHFKALNDNVEALIAGIPHAGISEGAVGQPARLLY